MDTLRLDGHVAIVTGAGGGLGRSHAKMLAQRGAHVVVNDLGSSLLGSGQSKQEADAVVDEIRQNGGSAVANYDSVEDGQQIVECALDTFGRVDILVNNAGIVRDIPFNSMKKRDWDRVLNVHLHGTFAMTHAVWPFFQKQNSGRILVTTSAAGLYGNFGQVNYATAKAGLIGFTKALAQEGLKHTIHINAIAPIAQSRMTESLFPSGHLKALSPDYISALVVYLCHPTCQETGAILELGGGWFSKLRWERSIGYAFPSMSHVTPEDIAESWHSIVSFETSEHPSSANEALRPILEQIPSSSTTQRDAASTSEVTLEETFQLLRWYIEAHTELRTSINSTFAFDFIDTDQSWVLGLKVGSPTLQQASIESIDCRLKMHSHDFLQMSLGQADPFDLFMAGKIEISGDTMAAQKLDFLQEIDPQMRAEGLDIIRSQSSK